MSSSSSLNSNGTKNGTTNEGPTIPPPTTGTTPTLISSSSSPTTRSSQSIVMGFATGYELNVYKRYVGSLRKTGFRGKIILAVHPTIKSDIENYLIQQNVTIKKVQYVNCSYHTQQKQQQLTMRNVSGANVSTKANQKELSSCVKPYPNLKARWGRFPLLRDYLIEECGDNGNGNDKCKGGGNVLITDVRDTYFQEDPFSDSAPKIYGLQLFQEDPRMRTTNWLVQWPVKECKGITFDEPMLCSGTIASGTKRIMLKFLDIMYNEMEQWMKEPNSKCHFQINGDDQSILNYLYYGTKKLSGFANSITNRIGIINTVGASAAGVRKDHFRYTNDKLGIPESEAQVYPYEGTNLSQGIWVSERFHLTDNKGYFTNLSGKRSPVVHQYDRFGYQLERWLKKHIDQP